MAGKAIVVFDAVRDTATLVTLDIPAKAFVFNTRPDIECSRRDYRANLRK
jgi:hypothetical protein